MRPFDSSSTFFAQGSIKYFGLAEFGETKCWNRKVTSCAIAEVVDRPKAATKAVVLRMFNEQVPSLVKEMLQCSVSLIC